MYWNAFNDLHVLISVRYCSTKRKRPMTSTVNARYIDFHSHFYDQVWFPSSTTMGQGILARAWPLLTDIDAQLAAMDDANIDAKVLSAPSALLVAPGKQLSPSLMDHINA